MDSDSIASFPVRAQHPNPEVKYLQWMKACMPLELWQLHHLKVLSHMVENQAHGTFVMATSLIFMCLTVLSCIFLEYVTVWP